MKTVIIAAAPTNAARFTPVYGKFPVSDSVLLDCMGSQAKTEEILEAACKLLGLSEDAPRVAGLYYRLPERQNRTFEQFLDDLEFRYRHARRQEQESRSSVVPRNRMDILQTIMRL